MLEPLLHVVMVLGLVCNVVALCVILRQNIRKPDLSLALIMAVSDLLLVGFKLGESILLAVLGKSSAEGGQWQGVVTSFLLQLSGVSVGCLAVLRFWVIVMRRKVYLDLWWLLFLAGQGVVLGFLVAVACEGQFESLQLMSLVYPAINSGLWVVEACRHLLLFGLIWPILAVNISYPCIARLYQSHLRLIEAGESCHRETRIIYAKIICFVLIYNLVMLPAVIVLVLEEITIHVQSPILETVSVVTLWSMTFFNPLVLLTLHHETLCEFKKLLSQASIAIKSSI